jgi:hypothetical protein
MADHAGNSDSELNRCCVYLDGIGAFLYKDVGEQGAYMGKIQDLYDSRVRPMSPAERLQLARLILNSLAPVENAIDVSDEWADDDLAEASAYSAQHGDGLNADAGGEP